MSAFPQATRFYRPPFAERVWLDGRPVHGHWFDGYAEALDVAGTQPALRCAAADTPDAAVGNELIRRNPVTTANDRYTVRNIQPLNDGTERVLILERKAP